MSVTVPYKAKVTGTNASPSVGTITPPTPGNTLLVAVVIPTANAPLVSLTDPLNGAWGAPDLSQALSQGGFTCYFYRKSNIPNAPTSLSATGTTGPFAATFLVAETASMENTSPVAATIPNAALDGGVSLTTHAATFTTVNTNDFVFLVSNNSNLRNLDPTLTTDMTVLQPETVTSQVHGSYLADAGAGGAKSKNLVFSGACVAYAVGVIYKAAKPAVTSVSSPTVNENGVLTYRVTLASAPTSITGYSGALAGYGSNPASPTADLTTTLLTAACTNGVTYSAGSFIVPTGGVTYWDVPLSVYDDALDEYDEQISLTVDGVVGVGTILDNDPFPNLTFSTGTENFGVVPIVATLDTVSGRDITFNVSTVNGTKTAGVDFTGLTNVPVTITAGNLSATVPVTVL